MNTTLATVVWDPVFPMPVIVLLFMATAVLGVWSTYFCAARLSRGRRAVLTAFRVLALALLFLPLFQPAMEESIPRWRPQRLALVALDTSQSMAEKDADGSTRLDAARLLVQKHQLNGKSPLGICRVYAFDADSRPALPQDLESLQAAGETTYFDTSLSGILRSLTNREQCVGLFVFTDGHDFEGVPPERLGQLARQHGVPIYPVPLGRTVHLPDVAATMISTQPSIFIGQETRLEAALRFRSCGARQARVELLRGDEVLREQRVTTSGDDEITVGFDVRETEAGQYEYAIRCSGPPEERDLENNTTITYLNVTDARIPLLLLEGEPHWDTSFLQRTLARNERMSLDAVFAVGPENVHRARSDATLPSLGEITPAALGRYPVVVVGRGVERLLSEESIAALKQEVQDRGLTLIFARGRPGTSAMWEELSPAPLGESFTGPVQIAAGGSRGSVAPLEVLEGPGKDTLPDLPGAAILGELKTLTSVEASAADAAQKNILPAMLLRQHGAGQVFAVALDGLWKWALHAGAETENNIYDRFWNQLLLNLIARSNRLPSDRAQLTVARANVQTGERIDFLLRIPPSIDGRALEFPNPPRIRIARENLEAGTVEMRREDASSPWTGAMIAEQAGRFRAETALPGGESVGCRFGVYTPQSETTDVATDVEYLRKLATASGGRVLDAASLPGMLENLERAAAAESAAPPMVRRSSLWDRAQVFWLLCGLFGMDWFLRRRWGLV
ncbi:MAG TPA: hypothetical protein VMN36_19065 [Verrucomicrobiales bacterium]|nr:hypothetical protein [Verrucomicrobiales bacterium]